MIFCKISNNTESGIALNWVRGGISIPRGSAAILDYDPFSIMDRNSSIYHNAMEVIKAGLVSIGYYVEKPAVVLESLDAPTEDPGLPEEREAKPVKNNLFREQEPYHRNDVQVNVAKTKENAPEAEPVAFDVTLPKDASKQASVPGGDPINEDAVPEVAPKKSSSKKTKKL